MPDDQRTLTGEILPPLDKVETSVGAASFGAGLRVQHLRDVGLSIEQLIKQEYTTAPPTNSLMVELVVSTARVVVPHSQWHLVRPKGGVQVYISEVAQGSPKKILRSVLLITVAVAAFYTGGLAAGALVGEAAAGSLGFLLVQGVTAVAITAVGALAINALLPVRPPSQQVDEARTSAGSLSNRLAPGAPVPVVMGDMRVYPPFAAAPYTENVGEDRYQVALLTVGHGPVKISDLRIGTIPIEDYEDVMLDIREGWATDPAIGIYQNEVTTDQHGVLLEPGVWQEFTTRANTDEAAIDFVFEKGLALIDEKGKRQYRTVAVDVQYRVVGSSTWLTLNTYQNVGTTNVRIPFVNFSGFNTPALDAFEGGTAVAGVAGFSFQGKKPVARAFTKELHFPARGQYEVRFRRTTAAAPEDGDETILDEVKLAIIRSIKHEPPLRGQAVQKGLGLIAIKLRLTDQKAGAIQDLNCRVQRYYPVWNGTSFIEPEATYAAGGDMSQHLTRNPAAAFCYAIRGSAGKRTMPDSRLHMETIGPWWSACDAIDPRTGEVRFTYDRTIEQSTTLKALLQQIAHVGRARLDGPDGRTGVVRDELQTDPKGVFTPRNMRGFKGSFALGEEIHAARVTFANEDNHYQEDTITVYADGWNEETATSFLDLTHPGCTRTAQAHVYGRDQLLALKYRPEPMEFDAPVDAMHNRIGDYVVVHTNMAVPVEIGGEVQEGAAARIAEIYENGSSEITSVKLDSQVPVKAGIDYSLIIRRGRKAGMTVTAEVQGFVSDTTTDTFNFTAPLTDTQAIDDGCLVVLGETNRVARDCIITAIRPSGSMEFKVKVLDLAPEIQNSQTEGLPVFPVPAGFSQDPVPERVDNLTLTELLVYDGGLGRMVITARWEPNNTAVATSRVEIYEVDGSNYIKLGETTDNKFELPGSFTAGETVEIAVVAVSPSGAKRPTYLARRTSLLLTLEADTATDIVNITGSEEQEILPNAYFKRGTAGIVARWRHTNGWTWVNDFTRPDLYPNEPNRLLDAMRLDPVANADEYLNEVVYSDHIESGPRLWSERFDIIHRQRANITFYGDTRPDAQESAANGEMSVGLVFFDVDGNFLDEIIHGDPVKAHELLGGMTRSFVAPEGSRSAEAFALVQEHTQGHWFISGSTGKRSAPSDQSSVLDAGDGPRDIGATDGATVDTNLFDDNGLILAGDDIITANGQLQFDVGWDFGPTTKGWTAEDVSLSANDTGIVIDTLTNDSKLFSPAGLKIDGRKYDKVVVRLKRLTVGDGEEWEGPFLYYATDAHGFSPSYRKFANTRFVAGTYATFTFDMANLSVGGDDWVNSIITQLRFDPTHTSNDQFEIDYIGVAKVRPALAVPHAANLVSDLGFKTFAPNDTDSEETFAGKTLDAMNLAVGQQISASIQVLAQGARRGRLRLDFEGSGLVLDGPWSSITDEYQTLEIEGEHIPAGTTLIRGKLIRETGVAGAVGARNYTLNRGSVAVPYSPVREDVEEGANQTTNTNQLNDGAGLGTRAVWGAANITGQPSDNQLLNALQNWAEVTGADKPADNADVTDYTNALVANGNIQFSNGYLSFVGPSGTISLGSTQLVDLGYTGALNATRNTGALADRNDVSENEVQDGAATDRPASTEKGYTAYTVNGGVKITNDVTVNRKASGQSIMCRARFRLDPASAYSIEDVRLEIRRGSSTEIKVLPLTITDNYYTYSTQFWDDGTNGSTTYHMRVSSVGNVNLPIQVSSAKISALVPKR